MGRTVPWICWQEWYCVRDWLLSDSTTQVKQGIRRVQGWRARGRVPLGVDVTACLLETALSDPGFRRLPAVSSAAAAGAAAQNGVTPADGSSSHTSLTGSNVSTQQLRLQYSAIIVRWCHALCSEKINMPPDPWLTLDSRIAVAAYTRVSLAACWMVNGIADSQQRGRMALSVNRLAESAAISRLLVDVRHEATHNELPSLSTLRLAARQALDWLVCHYWHHQTNHLSACNTRVVELLSAILSSCEAAAAAGARHAAEPLESDAEDAAAAAGDGHTYKAADGRKQRKNTLAELKVLLPPSHTPLLVTLLLKNPALFTQPLVSACGTQRGAPSLNEAQAQQHMHNAAAQQSAFLCIMKQYSAIAQQLLEGAVGTVCSAAAAAAAAVTSSSHSTCTAADAQEHPEVAALQWLEFLLPDPSSAVVDASGAAAPSSSRSAIKTVPSARQVLSVTPSTVPQGPGCVPAVRITAVQQRVLQQVPAVVFRRLIKEVLECITECSASSARVDASTAAARQGKDSITPQKQVRLLADLHAARQMLLSGLGAAAGKPSNTSALKTLCTLGAPPRAQKQQLQQVPVTDDWHQQQVARLKATQLHQQQLTGQKRTQSQLSPQFGTSSRPGGGSSSSSYSDKCSKVWKRVVCWQPSAIGCLPEAGSRHADRLLLDLEGHQDAAVGGLVALGGVTASAPGDKQGAATTYLPTASGAQIDEAMAMLQPAVGQKCAAALNTHSDVLPATQRAVKVPHVEATGGAVQQSVESDFLMSDSDADQVTFGRWWQLSRLEACQLQHSVQLLI